MNFIEKFNEVLYNKTKTQGEVLWKKKIGITIIALIITVILMAILLGVGVHFGMGTINKAKLEDIKTDMITIKSRAKIIVDEYNYEDIDSLEGVLIEDSQLLQKLGIEEGYIWDRQALDNQGLNTIEENKYVVTYDLENPNDTEVYFIEGYDGEYSLTSLQEK